MTWLLLGELTDARYITFRLEDLEFLMSFCEPHMEDKYSIFIVGCCFRIFGKPKRVN